MGPQKHVKCLFSSNFGSEKVHYLISQIKNGPQDRRGGEISPLHPLAALLGELRHLKQRPYILFLSWPPRPCKFTNHCWHFGLFLALRWSRRFCFNEVFALLSFFYRRSSKTRSTKFFVPEKGQQNSPCFPIPDCFLNTPLIKSDMPHTYVCTTYSHGFEHFTLTLKKLFYGTRNWTENSNTG